MNGKKAFRQLALAVCLVLTCHGESGIPGSQGADRDLLKAPILFAKRFNYQGLHIYDTFYQWRPGGGIYVLENPAEPQEKQRIRAIIDATTTNTLGAGIYFDPSLSYDAKRLLFCFKGEPKGPSTIYEINVDGSGLRQVTNLDNNGNPYKGSGGGHHDVKPCYMPDGRIVFTSTRYSGLVPCANNGVAILHVMNPDGSDIHTISVNNVTEFDPCVLPDGRILFGRWEYVDRNALVIQSLWTILPDGRNETALYGNNMVFPEAILQAKPVPGDDALMVATFAPHNAPPRGTIAMIDTRIGKNDPAAIINFESPAKPTHDRGDSCDPWPLNAHVVLYSGKLGQRNSTLNALMLIDRSGKKVLIHSDPTIDLHNPIPLVPRPLPRTALDMTDRTKTTGAFFVNDVYVSMPNVKRGTIKWLRVLEETSRVSGTAGGNGFNQTFSISAALAWSAKIFHGIVPVEEDGSVYFEAPSGRALYFQLLDKDYKMVRSMRTFIQAAPGTTRSCSGCHEYAPKTMGMPRLADRKPKQLSPESWGSGWLDYSTRIQPLFDAKCVSCHGGAKGLAKGLDLSAGWTEVFNISYENLTARRERMYTADMVGGICGMNGTAYWACKVFGPYEHGSGKAILADMLLSPTHSKLLTHAEKELVFAWMDSNAMYSGTWDYTQAPPRLPAYPKTVKDLKGVMREAGCIACHADDKGAIKRFDNWINFDKPEMSTILRAALPQSTTEAGGYGLALCRERKVDQTFSRRGVFYSFGYAHSVKDLETFPTQVWSTQWPVEGKPVTSMTSTNDPHYQKMLALIRAGRTEMLAKPRVDMPGAERIGINAGRARQILPQGLPVPLPQVKSVDDSAGGVRLAWESSARMIGLIAEVHRGPVAHFTPDATTLIGRTERSTLCDTNPPPGKLHYAVVFLSDPAETCGTVKSGAVYDYQHTPELTALPPGQRCPLTSFKPLRSEPVWVSHRVTASYSRTDEIIYGRKYGVALTMNLLKPAKTNGAAVVWVISGGFFSSHEETLNAGFVARVEPLLDRGYTVFLVVHGSAPQFELREITKDIHRAVRFVRYHAKDYGIDPQRIGITGGSAGGYLATWLGTTGCDGDPASKDPVNRVSSRVQAVACFYPGTDWMNFPTPGEDVIAISERLGTIAGFRFKEYDSKKCEFIPVTEREKVRELLKELSPINHVTAEAAPMRFIYGDKDTITTLETQGTPMQEKLKAVGVPCDIIVKPGLGHSWPGIAKDSPLIADWFDTYLLGLRAPYL
jgi:acetyl esterase/lipase/mono/diheme cytochrome c family protein